MSTSAARGSRSRFACPKCGAAVAHPPPAPSSRQTRCESCGAVVLVPYLPRARFPRHHDSGWAWLVIVSSLAVIVVGGVYILVRARIRHDRHQALVKLITEATQDERLGRWEHARDRLDAALPLAGRDRRDELIGRRNRAAEQARRQRRDSLIQSARDDLDHARSLLQASLPDAPGALARCARADQAAIEADDPRSGPIREEARALATRLIAGFGLVLEPLQGTFLDGAAGSEALGRELIPLLADQFQRRGYLPRPDDSPWRDLWESLSPFRLATTVSESRGTHYFESPHRTARIEVHLELSRAGEPAVLWTTNLRSQTRTPSPRMNVFTAGYIGVSHHRDPKIERLLYEDARARLIEQLPQKLGSLNSPRDHFASTEPGTPRREGPGP